MSNPTFVTAAAPQVTAYEQIGGNQPLGELVGGSSTSLVGFYGTAPIVLTSLAAAATDTTTAITLANSIRTNLLAIGLFKA